MQIGFVGLGKMGSRMAEKLVREGHRVVVWNRSENAVENFSSKGRSAYGRKWEQNVIVSKSIEELIGKLEKPRIIWLMLPQGEATENVLQEVMKNLSRGLNSDIIIDGGNAFYKDTERRSKELRAKALGFLGVGVSGGIKAFENGYPLMVGGDRSAYDAIKPLLDSLSKPHGGYEYFGEGGAGHFVKMVHNGIEYGMMQAIGEGFGVLDNAPYDFDLQKVAELWQKNTIVSSFLMDCVKDALVNDPNLETLTGHIDATGEAEWTVNQAKEEKVFAENIEQSLDFRRRSKTDKKVSSSFAARMIAALRKEFGGHAVQGKVSKVSEVPKA